MKQLSVNTFLEVVERSGLVDKSRLTQSLAELECTAGAGAISDSLIVSNHLTRSGLLTDWQREQLLDGRSRGFFVGKYKLLAHLGTGGMSCVYLAEHVVMRRRVAVKILPTNRVNDSSYLARFHREARAVAALDHPNIVRAFDVDNDEDTHYLVMEYVEGHDLRVLVERDGPLPFDLAANYIRQAADGLAHAHQAGLVHRDMKPANLLIDKQGIVKILDLGLARSSDDVDASLTNEHDEKMLGTVDYLAPEQALDSHLVDPRADIYSLGCTLYFALTGRPPFPDGTLAQRVLMHQSKEPTPIAQLRPDAPADLVAICRRMMAKAPSARYPSAQEVGRALAQWRENDAKRPRAPAPAPAQAKPVIADEDLTLAPLDDEPARAKPAVVSASGSAASKTQAAESAASKSAASQSKASQAAAAQSAAAKVSASKSGSSSATASKSAASKSGPSSATASKSSPVPGVSKPSAGSSQVKPPAVPAPAKPAAAPGKTPTAPQKPTPAAGRPATAAPAKAGPATPAAPRGASSSVVQGRRSGPAASPTADTIKNDASQTQPLSPPAKTSKPPVPQTTPSGSKPAELGLPEEPRFDDLLLADLSTLAGPLSDAALGPNLGEPALGPAALGGPSLGSSLTKPQAKAAAKGKHWDSIWFLIGVGTLLAGAVIGCAALIRWLIR